MSVYGTRHITSGLSVRTDEENTDAEPHSFFDKLYPHMRHVKAHTLTGGDLIYDYLTRRGVRTVDQIVQRTEYDKGQVKRILETQPRFQKTKGGWTAVEQAPATVIEGRTIAEKIHNYLMSNGSSTVTQITRAIGCANYQAVDENLRRGRVKAAVRAGIDETSGRRATLWAVEPVKE